VTWFTATVEDGDGEVLLFDQGGWTSLAGELFGIVVRAVFDGRGDAEDLGDLTYRMTLDGELLAARLAATIDSRSRHIRPGTPGEGHQQRLARVLARLDPLADYRVTVDEF
jgi:hypothetical protein